MSVDLSWTVDDVDGVRFVACRVHNEADIARRVRIDSLLGGPVLPPRRSGVPEAGWDRDGVTLRLDPGERRGVGFASPAPTADPPVEIADIEPLAADESGSEPTTPAEAIRTLGEHRPPGDAVVEDAASSAEPLDPIDSGPDTPSKHGRPAADGGATANSPRSSASTHGAGLDRDGSDSDECAQVSNSDDSDFGPSDSERAVSMDAYSDDHSIRSSCSPPDRRAGGPNRIDDWFDAVERRIERAERLTDGNLDSATEAVAALGGTDAVADLDRRVAADAELCRRVSERAASLAERAEETNAPIEALERLS